MFHILGLQLHAGQYKRYEKGVLDDVEVRRCCCKSNRASTTHVVTIKKKCTDVYKAYLFGQVLSSNWNETPVIDSLLLDIECLFHLLHDWIGVAHTLCAASIVARVCIISTVEQDRGRFIP